SLPPRHPPAAASGHETTIGAFPFETVTDCADTLAPAPPPPPRHEPGTAEPGPLATASVAANTPVAGVCHAANAPPWPSMAAAARGLEGGPHAAVGHALVPERPDHETVTGSVERAVGLTSERTRAAERNRIAEGSSGRPEGRPDGTAVLPGRQRVTAPVHGE